jgi:Icc-related predicted phosphoesterase
VVAGDIVNHDIEKAKKFLAHLAQADRPVFFVPGNMDNIELKAWQGSGNVHALHGRCEYFGNIALIGLGGSPGGIFSTPYEYSEDDAAALLDSAKKNYHGGKLVLVSHCPPRNTKIDRTLTGQHIGSSTVRSFVETNHPTVVISGHVHEAQGTDSLGSSVLVNTGPAKSGNYVRIALEDNVRVTFSKL